METRTTYRTKPLKMDFGLESVGLDVTQASRPELGEVADATFRYGAVVRRDQKLDPTQQIAFTSFFGEPAENARTQFTVPEFPEVFVISNRLTAGRRSNDAGEE